MLEFLSRLFQSLAPLWEMSVTAAYVSAVVIVLRLLLKKRIPKQVFCLLWLVVFARLLIPVSLESPLSIVPDALPGQERQLRLPDQSPGAGQPAAPAQPNGPAQNITPNQPADDTVIPVIDHDPAPPSLAAPEGAAPAAPQPEAPAPFPWQAVLAGAWLAGSAALALYALFSYLRLRRRLFDAIRAKDGAWEHPAVNSPFILGMLRPRIYLPAGLAGQPRQFILCHERAHLRRLDHIVKPVCWAALALHWFNPLVWVSFLLMSRDIEAACDEAVIRRLGSEVKADYSATLLALATNRRVPAPCPLAFDEGDAKGRIKNVLRYRRPALWIVVVSALAAVLAAVCLLTDPVAAKGSNDDPNADPSPSASQEPVNLADTLLDPWMREVLDGERTFRDAYREHNYGDGLDFTIHQLRTMVYGDEELPKVTVEVGRLAVIDLDRDGINEMVVWPTGESDDPTEIGYYTGYFIFRRQGDMAYVYFPGWRSIARLKADGTFDWDSSAFEWGTGSVWFDENMLEVKRITWQEGMETKKYFVNGLSATQEEFDTAYDVHAAKPEPTWYTYKDGVLAPWRPDGMELAAEANPDFNTGEARLWLDGGESPWLEWNGTTARLNGLITPAQSPWLYVRDFDGDGQDEVVLTWYINGFAQYDLYEWDGSRPVLMDSYDSQQMLVRFNQNNVAGIGPWPDGGLALTLNYVHVEGEDTPTSTDFYRHYVSGHALLPDDFFDGGYEHIRDGYPHAYANGFHLVYLQRETNQFYFDFDIYLADETMQELNYVDTLLGDPPYSEYADHYMIGKAVGAGGFFLAYDGTEWKLKEWDQLSMDFPDPTASPSPAPIPLDYYALPDPLPVPDFLDAEQQLLYRRAYVLYLRLFGHTNDDADFWAEAGDDLLPPAETVQRGGLTYSAARGLYGLWDDFERAVLSVFTRESWDAKNTFDDNGNATYINVDGRMYYLNYGRSGGNYNGNFPETFRLVERTDDAISFIMTAYYSNSYPLEGETYADVDARMVINWEYSIDFPMRMVKTADGWRFDEFHLAQTDGGEPFYSRRVLNPNALAGSPSPEPSPSPSAAPLACEHGLEDIRLEYVGSQLAARCGQCDFTYPVPGITSAEWHGQTGTGDGSGWLREDMDEDGQPEIFVFVTDNDYIADTRIVSLDVENGALVTHVFRFKALIDDFNQNCTYDMDFEDRIMTVSYGGQTGQAEIDDGYWSYMSTHGGGFGPEIWPTDMWITSFLLTGFPVHNGRGLDLGITALWSFDYSASGGLRPVFASNW